MRWFGDLVRPCFDCNGQPKQRVQRQPLALRRMWAPGQEVKLAVSPLGPVGLRGAVGYHTSVLVGKEEYYFSDAGIIASPHLVSHREGEVELIDIGFSPRGGPEMQAALWPHFPPGCYDLLRKNCNSFTDCALYFLCEERLDWGYRGLEQLAKVADTSSGIVQSLSQGRYAPNPLADDFDLEVVIMDIDVEREAEDEAHSRPWENDNERIDDGIRLGSGL